jgi:polyphosphate kinase
MSTTSIRVGGAKRAQRRAVKPGRFGNRELGWVDFDQRVLELAADASLPLLERVNLCAIVSSNLDEFFAVRVGRLRRQLRTNPGHQTVDGRTAAETLQALRRAVVKLEAAQDALWSEELRPLLAKAGIRVCTLDQTTPRVTKTLEKRFGREVEPLLTPIAVGRTAAFPHIASGAIAIAAAIRDPDGSRRFVCIKVPRGAPRFISAGNRCWTAAEDLITRRMSVMLGGATIEASAVFRPIRDADLAVPDGKDDLLEALEGELDRRRTGDVVRLEVAAGATRELLDFLVAELGVTRDQIYERSSPVGLAALSEIAKLDRPDLVRPAWQQTTPRAFANRSPSALLTGIRRRDVLIHHPYESFERSVQAFVDTARDPRVAALKTTIYRAGDPAPTLSALVDAAGEQKHAVSIVEVRARFDEQRNIEWSRVLKRSGVDVIHGAPDAKVHAKLALVVRNEKDGARRYVHVGTGNYHASNAFLYEDVSLFTADPDICADVADVFTAVTAGTHPAAFRKLLVAPWFLRDGLVREIDEVVRAARLGQPAQIRIKVNAVTDPEIVDALYAASQSGVDVDLIVRGVCMVRPGVPGLSDRITVRSVLGRFLEHSRIYSFRAGDRLQIYLGSPDLMTRNLDRRVETLVPIEDSRLRGRVSALLETLLSDTSSSWTLGPDASWRRVTPRSGRRPLSAQASFMRHAAKRSRKRS